MDVWVIMQIKDNLHHYLKPIYTQEERYGGKGGGRDEPHTNDLMNLDRNGMILGRLFYSPYHPFLSSLKKRD